MVTVIRGDQERAVREAARRPSALVVSVGVAPPTDDPVVHVAISVAEASLARRLEVGLTRALRKRAARARSPLPSVRVGSRKAFEQLRDSVPGAVAVVPITRRNLPRLKELVAALRSAGALAVQLVWDGADPARDRVEPKVFAILELARSTPAGPPVVLARREEVVDALRLLV